jgi:DNA-binding SARP family transcriptional activator
MEIRLLGPLEVVDEGHPVNLGGPRQRVLLAVLALNANRVTPFDRLVDAVWGDKPPPTARAQIQSGISQLRRGFARDALAADVITTRDSGYLLSASIRQLDSELFTKYLETAREQAERHDPHAAVQELRAALALWRGPALMGVGSDLVRRSAARLDELRLSALEELHRLNLALGLHAEICGELFELIEREPLRERLYGYLMLALYRAGRQAEALDVYRRARAVLTDELGIEPGRELRRLELAILQGDAALDLAEQRPARPPVTAGPPADTVEDSPPVPPSPAPRPRTLGPPRQLPRDIGDFTGREEHVAKVRRQLTTGGSSLTAPHSVSVVGIIGTGGIGKSALAVRVAHELATAFPDGQLYADVHGVSDARTCAGVTDRFLRALGVASHAVPEDPVERMALYRSTLAGKRVLIVLDDVADDPALQNVIPGSSSCAVIMTSRTRLASLSSIRRVSLPVFDRELSVELLARIAGRERVHAEQEETFELAEVCAGLPLALRIAGARLAYRPHWQISRLVRRLRDEAVRIDELAHGALELRSTIALSYRTLDEDARRLVRLLSLLAMREFPAWAAAALMDLDPQQTEDILDTLVDVQLVEVVSGRDARSARYQCHDLIRVYAKERLQETETAEQAEQALRRVLRTWLALAEEMHRREYGGDYTILHGTEERRPPPDEAVAELVDGSMEHWERERTALAAAVRQASELGLDELCWDLAHTAVTLYEAKGYIDDWRETSDIGLATARRAGNRRGEAVMLYSLATLHMYQGRLDAAEELFGPARGLFDAIGDVHGSTLVLRNLAFVDRLRGDREGMKAKYASALRELQRLDDKVGVAHVLCGMATVHLDEGAPDDARPLLAEALDICKAVGCARVEAQVIYRLGELHLGCDETELAGQAFGQALRIVRSTSDPAGEAHALYGVGQVWLRDRRPQRAKESFAEALGAAERAGDLLMRGQVLLALGRAEHQLANRQAAVEHLGSAAETLGRAGATLWQSRALVALAEVHAGTADGSADERACLTAAAELLASIDPAEAAALKDAVDQRLTSLHRTP